MWAFLHNEQYRKILGWLGGGLVVIATGLWTAFVYFDKSGSGANIAPVDCSVTAQYSVAACGDVIGDNVFNLNN